MLDTNIIISKLAWLHELQGFSEAFQENLRDRCGDWWTHIDESTLDEIDSMPNYPVPGNVVYQLVCLLNNLRELDTLQLELYRLLGDEIQIFPVPGEAYSFMYVPCDEPIPCKLLTPGKFSVQDERCHVFIFYPDRPSLGQ